MRIADFGFKRRNLQLRLAFSFHDSKSSMTCLQPQAKRSSNLQRQSPKHYALFATDHGRRTTDKKPSVFVRLSFVFCQLLPACCLLFLNPQSAICNLKSTIQKKGALTSRNEVFLAPFDSIKQAPIDGYFLSSSTSSNSASTTSSSLSAPPAAASPGCS